MEILEALQNSLGFDWRITVANIINFAIVYFVLKRLVFDKLSGVLEERRNKIETGLDQAAEANVLREKAAEEREDILRNARTEATTIVTSAREKEIQTIDQMSAKAQIQADQIINDAKQKAAAEHAEMLRDFKRNAAELVVEATEKLLQDDIVSDRKKEVASKYLESVTSK